VVCDVKSVAWEKAVVGMRFDCGREGACSRCRMGKSWERICSAQGWLVTLYGLADTVSPFTVFSWTITAKGYPECLQALTCSVGTRDGGAAARAGGKTLHDRMQIRSRRNDDREDNP
jgi:hypothetical protein